MKAATIQSTAGDRMSKAHAEEGTATAMLQCGHCVERLLHTGNDPDGHEAAWRAPCTILNPLAAFPPLQSLGFSLYFAC